MELSDKIIQNLAALSSAILRGEKINVPPAAMAELWQDVAKAEAYLQAKKENAAKMPEQIGEALMVSQEHG